MNPNNAIELRNINLSYEIEVQDPNMKRGYLKKIGKTKIQNHVLDDLTLDVKKGEILGIIGTNGAGKSTLLSVMARIIEPDSGSVQINGKVATILELGMGFHSDLSGRENIILKGELYGFSKKQMESKTEEIIEYSGIRKYIDNPVRTYSSGMRSRLAFSIMIHVDAEIMLVDEILSTGDTAFSAKASDYFKKILKDGKTVVYVSHSPGSVESICTRAIWLDRGKIVADGKPKKISALYSEGTLGTFEILNDQAKSGLADSQYRLSQLYAEGNGIDKNEELYKYWLELAAEQGHIKAQTEYADYLLKTDNSNNRELAIMYYQSSAARGDTTARLKLSQLFGDDKYNKEYEVIKNIFRHQATNGNVSDMMRFANFLLKTSWNNDDRKESFRWYKKISDEYDHPDAIVQLAIMYRDGIGTKKDKKKYIQILEKGTNLGIIKTTLMLADEYSVGKIVDEDKEKALSLYENCANNGVINSQYIVATMYLEGLGTNVDLEKANYWFDIYTKSQLNTYQLAALAILKNNHSPGVIAIQNLYDNLVDSKDPKILIELNEYYSNYYVKDVDKRIEQINERLSKSYGKGMEVAFRYYSMPNSRGFDINKAIEIGKKMIYQANPETLYKLGILCNSCDDKENNDLGKRCMMMSANANYKKAIDYCKENDIDVNRLREYL